MSSNKKVSVWEYFKKSKDGAVCNLCNKTLKCSGGSTSSLWKHVKTQHTIGFASADEEVDGLYDKEAEQPKRYRITDAIANMENNSITPAVPLLQSLSTVTTQTAVPETPSASTSRLNIENEDIAVTSVTLSQQKITSVFLKKSTLQKRFEQITQYIVGMIAEDMLPLSFVEHSGFRKLMKLVTPNYQIPCRNTIRSRLSFQYNTAKINLKNLLASFEYVALTTDAWTAKNSTTSYITVTVHAISEEWTPFSCNIVTEEMSERHTSENMRDRLQAILEEWELTNRVCAVVHDNAKNITKAIKLNRSSFGDYIPCFAHTLQLCINSSLEASPITVSLLEVCRKIVSYFHRSNTATGALKEKQELLSLKQHKLIQSVATRWNSTYYMLERLYEQRQAIISVLADRDVTTSKTATSLQTSELDWVNISKLLEILKPFEISTTLLCSEKNITLSMAKPLMQSLLDHFLRDNDEDAQHAFILTIKENMRNEMQQRFALHSENVNLSLYDTCSLLDPRFVNNVKDSIKKLGKVYLEMLEKKVIIPNNENAETQKQRQSAMSFLFPVQEAETYLSETTRYFDETPLNTNGDIYNWWKDKESKYPKLSKIAKKYLAIPATSAPSERVFSTAGNIVTNKRNCLLPENVDMLVFLHENKAILSKLLENDS